MKIVISPSKTMEMHKCKYLDEKELLFPKKQKKVLGILKKFSKTDLSFALSIKGNILENTFKLIKDYNNLDSYHAFTSYTGLVFKNLDRESYTQEDYNYISNHVCILDAFYGIVEPGTLIKQYRLDMKAKIGINLYKHWDISDYFSDELIINLASNEFSTMIKKFMINIGFLQNKNGAFVNQATYSKMARGKFLNYLIQNKITSLEEMKEFQEENYVFNESLSDEFNLIFTR